MECLPLGRIPPAGPTPACAWGFVFAQGMHIPSLNHPHKKIVCLARVSLYFSKRFELYSFHTQSALNFKIRRSPTNQQRRPDSQGYRQLLRNHSCRPSRTISPTCPPTGGAALSSTRCIHAASSTAMATASATCPALPPNSITSPPWAPTSCGSRPSSRRR
ncbi:hypothetical protein D3C72_1894250 [compost metagenome]